MKDIISISKIRIFQCIKIRLLQRVALIRAALQKNTYCQILHGIIQDSWHDPGTPCFFGNRIAPVRIRKNLLFIAENRFDFGNYFCVSIIKILNIDPGHPCLACDIQIALFPKRTIAVRHRQAGQPVGKSIQSVIRQGITQHFFRFYAIDTLGGKDPEISCSIRVQVKIVAIRKCGYILYDAILPIFNRVRCNDPANAKLLVVSNPYHHITRKTILFSKPCDVISIYHIDPVPVCPGIDLSLFHLCKGEDDKVG